MKNISPVLFRAYDIRGIVDETLTEEAVYAIGLAIGSEAAARGQQRIVIARDGRNAGPRLSRALCEGLRASGRDVIDIGAVPTPVLYYVAHQETGSGIMLTGSHNPPNYNGLKIMLAGETLSGEQITALYHRIVNHDLIDNAKQGLYSQREVIDEYLDAVCERIVLTRPLKIVIDCGNGIAGRVAPALYERLGATVIPLYCEVDGNFPNHHPDPAQPKNLVDLIAAVKEHKADVGLAFDGDGDRLGAVTEQGDIVWPDRLLMLFARDVLSRAKNSTILFDIKCSHLLGDVIRQHGGVPLMWKTGHSLIKAKIKETNASLAGEMSGHFFFAERWYGFDDALYAGARLLEIMAKEPVTQTLGKTMQALPDCVTTPEMHVAVAEENKFGLVQSLANALSISKEATVSILDGIRLDFPYGWGLVRASNTTPVLVTRFEADTELNLEKIKLLFRDALVAIDKNLQIPF